MKIVKCKECEYKCISELDKCSKCKGELEIIADEKTTRLAIDKLISREKPKENILYRWETSDGWTGKTTDKTKEEFEEYLREGIKLTKWERIKTC